MVENNLNPSASIELDLKHLGRETIFALFLQITGVLLTYLVQVCVARWMGEVEYGIYTYVVAWCLVLAIPTGLGFPRAAFRMQVIGDGIAQLTIALELLQR